LWDLRWLRVEYVSKVGGRFESLYRKIRLPNSAKSNIMQFYRHGADL